MPGISIIQKSNDLKLDIKDLDYLLYEDNYHVDILYQNDHIAVINSSYKGYPVKSFITESHLIVLEGMVYNFSKKDIHDKINDISSNSPSTTDFRKDLEKFIKSADGEFIVYVVSKDKNEYYAFGDRWGRLKAYIYHSEKLSIISRDHAFVLNNIPKIEIDQDAVAEFISFELTLNNKTIISGIERTSPAFLFVNMCNDNSIYTNKTCILPIVFKTKKTKMSQNDIVLRYKNYFMQSLESRITKLNELKYNISSDLSGGLDSRSVYFGLCKFDIDVQYFTDELISGDESTYAINVAKVYNKPINIVKTKRNINIPEMKELTYKTGCSVNSITTLSCYQDAKERKNMIESPTVKFGGLGGSYLRHAFKRVHGYKNISSMVFDNIHVRGLPVKLASELVKSNTNRIKQYFENYSETNLHDKLKHFYFDYNNNVVNMGEDRARIHFWTVHPFLSNDLFTMFSHIPMKYLNINLFLKFLKTLDPRSYEPALYHYKLNLKSKISIVKYLLQNKFSFFIRHNKFIRKSLIKMRSVIFQNNKSLYIDDTLVKDIVQILNTSEYLKNIFDIDKTIEVILNNRKEFDIKPLISVILYLNEIEIRHHELL